jgi:hypothetical protein
LAPETPRRRAGASIANSAIADVRNGSRAQLFLVAGRPRHDDLQLFTREHRDFSKHRYVKA